MSKIEIRKVGPLDSVEIDLKKINVFIGPQSSGKSTLIKIICFCKWVEKRALTTLKDEMIADGKALFELLKTFHRLKETYFQADSYFKYDSEYVQITYSGGAVSVKYTSDDLFLQSSTFPLERKVIYVPAERNIVSALPNVTRYDDANDNLLNFFYDWFGLRRHYTEDNPLKVLSLGVSYYYDEKSKRDIVVLKDGQKLSLQYASSGLQSIIPLLLLFDYLGEKLFASRRVYSFETRTNLDTAISERGFAQKDDLLRFLLSREYYFTQFFFEEPEQNLFPSTQKELMEHLLAFVFSNNRDHELFLTTHSPYVLFTINNCILASQVQQHAEELSEIPAMKSPVQPKDVGLWAMRDGKLEDLQGKDGLVRKNYFDTSMKEIIGELNILLEQLDEEQ